MKIASKANSAAVASEGIEVAASVSAAASAVSVADLVESLSGRQVMPVSKSFYTLGISTLLLLLLVVTCVFFFVVWSLLMMLFYLV